MVNGAYLPKNPSEKWLKEFENEDRLDDLIDRIEIRPFYLTHKTHLREMRGLRKKRNIFRAVLLQPLNNVCNITNGTQRLLLIVKNG